MSGTTADSYLEASSREAGAAAELAASNKMVKYAGLSSQGKFVPIAIGGDDRGCSSIFVFIPTDFCCGATFQFGFAA